MNCSVCCEHHNVSTSFFSVFPAGAGVIHAKAVEQIKESSFPRRCGGDPNFAKKLECWKKFSPQVRG